MAFSTQKGFFHVPFMNESVELDCKKACVKLKRYESTVDNRSWASDETKQSKFLSDLVNCQYPADRGDGEGELNTPVDHNDTADVSAPKSPSSSRYFGKNKSGKQNQYDDCTDSSDKDDEIYHQLGNLTSHDSLLQCANDYLAKYQKVLNIKTSLEKQLEISNERLKTAKDENKRIREILANKLDSNTAKCFYNKIKKFTASGKLNKNEENEMLQIYEKMENMNKAYEVLQAENYYLKRLVEKLTARAAINNIRIQPEQSTDIDYLQNEVNSLRKECHLLRQMEDEYYRLKQQHTSELPSITEQDAENIKSIIKERNSLREKCKSFKGIEEQANQLKQQAQEAKKGAAELLSKLNNKEQYIRKMQVEIQNLQKYYDEKTQKACFREECLKAQLEDLRDELIRTKCEAQKANQLATEVSCLRNEIIKRNLELNDYDCQYKQLMDVVNELQSIKLQSVNDNETQTCESQTEELAFYTRATLDEIMKEIKKKGSLKDELMVAYNLAPEPSGTNIEYEKQCYRDMELLQRQVNEMKEGIQQTANCEDICADTLNRLKELETVNAKLLEENQSLIEKLKESEEKAANMLKKIEKLDLEINRNGQEANKIGADLQGAIDLVKDISEVQLKNQQLSNAVNAINSRDDQKIIDDLRRQLEQEQAKLNKCQQDNAKLQEEAKMRDIDLKVLKDLNNKLESDKKKLWMENNQLLSDKGNDKNINLTQSEIVEAVHLTDNPENRTQIESQEIFEIPSKSNVVDSNLFSDDAPDTSQRKSKLSNSDSNDKNAIINEYQEKSSTSKLRKGSTKKEDTPKALGNNKLSNTRKKEAALDDFVSKKDTPKALGNNKLSNTRKKEAALDDFVSKKDTPKALGNNKLSNTRKKEAALDDFVTKNSDTLKFNLEHGRCFEKEFRNILEDFIRECSYCFCRLFNTKSKLYAIGHKLCHGGISTLSFRELAYLHKKIYVQADQLVPGCLLDMILSDNKEQVEIMLPVVMPRLVDNKNNNFKTSDTNMRDVNNKCCCCKNELCCNNSEEMLRDKVHKLEKDIEIAREYLETLKHIPIEAGEVSDNGNSTDTNNSTYRAASPVINSQKPHCTKYFKKKLSR